VTAGPGQLTCYTGCLQLLSTLAKVAVFRPHLAETIKVRRMAWKLVFSSVADSELLGSVDPKLT